MSQEPLTLQLTSSLKDKLVATARDEGVSVDALAQELLAEGVVLRAWEIIERKSAMRAQASSHHSGHNGNGNGNRHRGNGSSGPRRGQAGGNWMEDRAAFLEYVRNQEKRR